MDIKFDGKYKSLGAFSFEEIPEFVVLTGPNGSGKTQLLELIQHSTITRRTPQATKAQFVGAKFTSDDTLHLPSEWNNLSDPKAVGLQVVQKQQAHFWSKFRQFAKNPNAVSHLQSLFQSLSDEIGKPPTRITEDEFTQHFDLTAPKAQTEVFNESVSQAFFDFRFRILESLDKGQVLTLDPPWDLLRQIISEAKIPFSFADPSEVSIRSSYTLALTHTGFGEQVLFSELSSGEKVLMSLVFWIFHVQRTGVFPRLLLLDEPDAHLHPEMCQQFLDVIQEVLVKKHKVRVIITTHSPTTVALAPRESLFEMFPSGERIRKSQSKSETIRRLTAGLINVSEAKSVVIVEDEDDEKFFQCLFDELSICDGDSATESLRSGERLVFIQASRPRLNRKKGSTSGGKSEVQKWVPKLRGVGLDSICGLVDRDNENDAGDSIHLLERYSIENYLVDPVLVFARLVAEGQIPAISGIPTAAKNREHLISGWGQDHLQKIADEINSRIWSRLENNETANSESASEELDRVEVRFTNGVKLLYPRWLLQRRGKDLLRAHIDEFGGQYVNCHKLMDTFQQVMLVPTEFVELFTAIQSRTPFNPTAEPKTESELESSIKLST